MPRSARTKRTFCPAKKSTQVANILSADRQSFLALIDTCHSRTVQYRWQASGTGQQGGLVAIALSDNTLPVPPAEHQCARQACVPLGYLNHFHICIINAGRVAHFAIILGRGDPTFRPSLALPFRKLITGRTKRRQAT